MLDIVSIVPFSEHLKNPHLFIVVKNEELQEIFLKNPSLLPWQHLVPRVHFSELSMWLCYYLTKEAREKHNHIDNSQNGPFLLHTSFVNSASLFSFFVLSSIMFLFFIWNSFGTFLLLVFWYYCWWQPWRYWRIYWKLQWNWIY